MSTYDSPAELNVPVIPPVPQASPQMNVGKKKKGRLKGLAAAGPAKLSRVVLGAILGLLFIGAWIGSGPGAVDAGSPSDWKSELNAASLKNTMNNGETKGAPQQTVVNGWYANDIAAVTASQNTYMAASSARNGTLLMLIGLGIAGELVIRGLEGIERTKKQHRPSQTLGETR